MCLLLQIQKGKKKDSETHACMEAPHEEQQAGGQQPETTTEHLNPELAIANNNQEETTTVFTPRSILRRYTIDDTTADAASTTKKSLRATVSADVSYMSDALLEPETHNTTEVPLFDRLYLDAIRIEADRKIAQETLAKVEEAQQAKKCTFDPLTTRKKGKGGKEAAAHPPYRTFNDFLQEQERWLKQRPGRLEKLERQAIDIQEGKRDVRNEMGKTTKSLIARMQKDHRYMSPSSKAGWQQRFQEHLIARAGIDGLIQTELQAGNPTADLSTTHRRKDFGDTSHPFSPIISAYATSKAARERGELGSMSPLRQRWEEDPAGFMVEGQSMNQGQQTKRASDTVFEKLYQDSAVRAAAGRILAESLAENEQSTLFKPKTNDSWAFSSARGAGSAMGAGNYSEYSNSFNTQYHSTIDEGSPLPYSTSSRPIDVVVQSLYAKGQEYKENKERLRQQLEESKELHSFKPQTNKRSHQILADYAKRAEEELTNELVRQTLAAMQSPDVVDPPNTIPAGVTGIPVPKKAAKFDVQQFTMRHERAAALKQAKLQAIAQQRDNEMFGECTFRPALASKSLRGYSPAGEKRAHSIYSPGSVASAYSASNPPSVPASARGTYPVSRNSSISSPLDGRHRPISRGIVSNNQSATNRSLGAFSGSIAGGGTPVVKQQQPFVSTSINLDSLAEVSMKYQIPVASVPPTERRLERKPSLGNLSATNSQRHDHHSFVEDGEDANEYLDNIENEMQGVLDEWRGVAKNVTRA